MAYISGLLPSLPPLLRSRRDGKGGVTWLDPFPASQFPAGAALALQTGRREALVEFEVF